MPDVYRDKACVDCGRVVRMHIKSKRCKACQEVADKIHNAEHRRAKTRGHTRAIGATSTCTVCGELYTVNSGMQKYCPACAPAATKAADSRATLAWIQAAYEADPQRREAKNAKRRTNWADAPRKCEVCGALFLPPTPTRKTCGETCQKQHKRQQQRQYDKKRNKERYQARKAAFDALPEETRREKQDEINRKARENYQKRKSEEGKP